MAAYFRFEQEAPDGQCRNFVFKLIHEAKIAEAREIVAGKTGLMVYVQGTIVPTKATYNPDWSFHLDPATIGFFEFQVEVCDANVTYIEEHLDEVGGSLLPRSFWCPWSSRLVAEVTQDIDLNRDGPR